MKERIEAAGFKPQRVSAIDGKKGGMRRQWREFLNNEDCEYRFDSDGQAGCALSHVKLWEDIVRNQIPFASVFEDDVMFHKGWAELAPQYYEKTNKATDIAYYGSQGAGKPTDPMVTQKHVFATHAYLISLEGATKLLYIFKNTPMISVIDCFLIEMMKLPICPFQWQCWNGTIYPDSARETALEYRNDGLVYQDACFESNIHCQAPPDVEK
jgi:GR25 family glycosyltransferase involved in LPS biosynthesis